MCLGVPLKIISINEKEAIGEFNGVKSKIRMDLIPDANINDFVMVHAGFGIEIIDETTAKETIDMLMEIEELMNETSEENSGR